MVKEIDYGELASKRRALKKQERMQQQAMKPPKPIKSKTKRKPPKLDWFPLNCNDYEPYDIDWKDKSTVEHSNYLAESYLSGNHAKLLVMPTGTGKTAISVATVGRLQEKTGIKSPVIVTAPTKTINSNGWYATVTSWNNAHPDNQIDLVLATSIDKFANVPSDGDTFVEVLSNLTSGGMIIMDEAHKYKNPTSKRSKSMHKFSPIKKLMVSATPLTNDAIMDMASYLIFYGLYNNKTQFINDSGIDLWRGKHGKYYIYDETGQIDTLKFPYYFKMLEQFNKLTYKPDVDISQLDMPLVKSKILQLDFDDELNSDMRSLAKAHRKRQFDSFTDYLMEICYRLYTDPKRLDVLMDKITQDGVKQPLIFYSNIDVKQAIIGRLNELSIDYQLLDGANAYEDLDLECLNPILIQYQSGAEGVEFKNSNCSCFYQNQFSYVTLEQSKGRNVRRKMSHEVTHYYFISDHAVDQEFFNRIQEKGELAEEILESIVEENMPNVI